MDSFVINERHTQNCEAVYQTFYLSFQGEGKYLFSLWERAEIIQKEKYGKNDVHQRQILQL